MMLQYVGVALIVAVAIVYSVVKARAVMKGDASNCESCAGCELKKLKKNDPQKTRKVRNGAEWGSVRSKNTSRQNDDEVV